MLYFYKLGGSLDDFVSDLPNHFQIFRFFVEELDCAFERGRLKIPCSI